jgi:hypothetical protein
MGGDTVTDDGERARLLVKLLLDRQATVSERDDAAMDLADFGGEDVTAALAEVASDPDEDSTVAASCGESLAEIWIRSGSMDRRILDRMTRPARSEAVSLIEARRPDWMA